MLRTKKIKKELLAASIILTLLVISFILFYISQPFRSMISDAYNSVFKTAISDRVLSPKSTIYSNISYCGTDDPRQTLDLYIPSDPNTTYSLVIFIHGGGWWTGDKSSRLLSYMGEDILENDMAIASINYRLAPQYTYPTQNEDIQCALTYLRKHAEKYNLSTEYWAAVGDSAGAQLGAMAVADPEFSNSFKAFVGFYGPYNLFLQTERQPNHDDSALQYTNNGADAQAASPYFAVGSKTTKYRLYHGEKDRIVPIAQSENFAEKLRNENIDVVFTPVKDAGHYFSPRTRPSNAAIKKQVIRFFQETL